MRLAVASDHGGFSLKQEIIHYLKEKKIEVLDLGNHGPDSVDYPDYAIKVAEMVSTGQADAGILMCGTGIGMSITANKFKNVRAAVVSDEYTAEMSKRHNNANILVLGSEHIFDDPDRIVRAWLGASFEGGRHDRRVKQISQIVQNIDKWI